MTSNCNFSNRTLCLAGKDLCNPLVTKRQLDSTRPVCYLFTCGRWSQNRCCSSAWLWAFSVSLLFSSCQTVLCVTAWLLVLHIAPRQPEPLMGRPLTGTEEGILYAHTSENLPRGSETSSTVLGLAFHPCECKGKNI